MIPQHTEFDQLLLDLLRQIFVLNPEERITAKKALKHPFFSISIVDEGTIVSLAGLSPSVENPRTSFFGQTRREACLIVEIIALILMSQWRTTHIKKRNKNEFMKHYRHHIHSYLLSQNGVDSPLPPDVSRAIALLLAQRSPVKRKLEALCAITEVKNILRQLIERASEIGLKVAHVKVLGEYINRNSLKNNIQECQSRWSISAPHKIVLG